eukprot:scaffold98985_cov72-Phaeocystis_antarctica.AAC.1
MAAQLPARPAVHAAALADKLYTPAGGKFVDSVLSRMGMIASVLYARGTRTGRLRAVRAWGAGQLASGADAQYVRGTRTRLGGRTERTAYRTYRVPWHHIGVAVATEIAEAVRKDTLVVVGMKWNPECSAAVSALEAAGHTPTYLEYGGYTSMYAERLAVKMWSGRPPECRKLAPDGDIVSCQRRQLWLSAAPKALAVAAPLSAFGAGQTDRQFGRKTHSGQTFLPPRHLPLCRLPALFLHAGGSSSRRSSSRGS